MVDLKPKVKRTDAIQAFTSQETPIVRIFADDGAIGIGYSYTIGTGGRSVIELIVRHLAPATDRPRSRARRGDLEGAVLPHPRHGRRRDHVAGACRDRHRALGHALPAVRAAAPYRGGRRAEIGAALHDRRRLAAYRDRRAGRGRAPRQGGRLRRLEDQGRPRTEGGRCPARGSARGGRRRFRDHGRRQPGRRPRRGDPPGPPLRAARPRLVRGADAGRGSRRPHPPLRRHDLADRGRRIDLQPAAFPRISAARGGEHRPGRRRPHRRHHALAEDRASRRVRSMSRSARIS